MLRGDFGSACEHLERAHATAPTHRGIMKSLGYCYVWLGDTTKAESFLNQIPEAKDELEVYAWWWDTHGRHDLSVRASQQLTHWNTQMDQP
jgi:hypothetical protein